MALQLVFVLSSLIHFTHCRNIIDSQDVWVPQYGTVAHPNEASLSSSVREGDVFIKGDILYLSLRSGTIGLDISAPGLSDGDWKQIQAGSLCYPLPVDATNVKHGDVIHDPKSGDYFVASSGSDGKVTREPFEYKVEWMTNLREQIGDRRLGDLLIPGTHDSATSGCGENSFLVERTDLFQFAQLFDPQILANWSKTQTEDLRAQLNAGFREFDLRIADTEDEDGSFRWWHGITGDTIYGGLDDIANFSVAHPGEILVIRFDHFAKPGDSESPKLPIPDRRKDELANILIEKLQNVMIDLNDLLNPRNPTVNEVLATGRNVIVEVSDSYIRNKHPAFAGNLVVGGWVGMTNPEELFVERSQKLSSWRTQYPDRKTGLSGTTTPATRTIIGGLLRVYGSDPFVRDIIAVLFPELLDVNPDLMSFEGQFVDLVTLIREGTNTFGMTSRPADMYTSGGSVHYLGMNDMIRYWAARPGLYKPNEIHIDDFVSSTAVDTAIQANRGEIGRQVGISNQGNAKDGYLRWNADDTQTEGGTDGLGCDPVQARFRVLSWSFRLSQEWVEVSPKTSVSFTEGQYPPDAIVFLEVSSGNRVFREIYANRLQVMIEENLDLYLRGASLTSHGGMAYVSYQYDVFGASCDAIGDGPIISSLTWSA